MEKCLYVFGFVYHLDDFASHFGIQFRIYYTLGFTSPNLFNCQQKLQGQNLDDWHNIRGPRPWENSKEFQEILRQHKEEDQRRAEKVWKKPAS